MAFVPVPNVVQANIRYLLEGQEVENVLSFERTEGWSIGAMEDLGSTLSIWVIDEIMPELSNEITFTAIYLTDQSSSTGLYLEVPQATGEVGGIVDDALPSTNAAIVSFLTAQRGRSHRGRVYIPGIAEGSVNGSVVDAGILTNLSAGFDLLNAAVASVMAFHVVVSRVSGGVPRTTGVTTPVNNYVARAVLGTQRRRRIGVGG